MINEEKYNSYSAFTRNRIIQTALETNLTISEVMRRYENQRTKIKTPQACSECCKTQVGSIGGDSLEPFKVFKNTTVGMTPEKRWKADRLQVLKITIRARMKKGEILLHSWIKEYNRLTRELRK